MNLFGSKYKDDEIVMRVEQAIVEEPMLSVMSKIGVSSQDGVVTLHGSANSAREKNRVEEAARRTLDGSGLKYDHIVNAIEAV